jgi:hypothetical protein
MAGTGRTGGVVEGRALPGGGPTGAASRRLAAVPASRRPTVARRYGRPVPASPGKQRLTRRGRAVRVHCGIEPFLDQGGACGAADAGLSLSRGPPGARRATLSRGARIGTFNMLRVPLAARSRLPWCSMSGSRQPRH